MKYFKYLLSIFCCVLIVSACDSMDFGNINKDDDVVTDASTESLMAGGMNRFFTLSGRDYHTIPNLYVQYQSQNQYTDEQRYNEAPRGWAGYYVQTLSNLKRIYEITTSDEVDEATRSYGAPVNQAGVAELMSAFIWKRITDTWGPVPYEQALSDETLTPTYSNQETIYKDLIARVKSARDMLDPSLQGPTGDVVYGGDVTKWQKFANSFIMSLSMQLSKRYPAASGYSATEFSAALNHPAGVVDEISEEMWYNYQNIQSASNPFAALRGADYSISEPFVVALRGNADGQIITYSNDMYDSRLNVFMSDTSLAGRPYGWDQYPSDLGPFAKISSDIRGPSAPLPYMTAAYTYLNRAEAAARGWTSELAQQMLINGIEMSYATVDAHWDDGSATSGDLQSDGTVFAASRIDDANIMQVISEEKWVAVFPMGFQGWSEWRRTRIPGLVPARDALNDGTIPTRYVYPADEKGVNAEAYQKGVNMLTPAQDISTAKFWWEIEG